MLRLRVLSLFALLAAGLAALSAPRAAAQVRATLVAEVESIQPGQPFTAALRLEHDPHWHTYWINPGTGLATNIEWTLPEGFSAGEIEWPTPTVLRDQHGTVIGNGYEGDVLLPVKITPPAELAPGAVVTLRAAVDWLMCDEVCIPGDAQLALALPVRAEAGGAGGAGGAPEPSRFAARIRDTLANLPAPLDDTWRASATRSGETITLKVERTLGKSGADAGEGADAGASATAAAATANAHAANATNNSDAAAAASALHFFADDDLVGYELPQRAVLDAAGGYTLTLKIAPDRLEENPARLVGVLRSSHGWRADQSLPGLRIDLPLRDENARGAAAGAGSVSPATSGGALSGAVAGAAGATSNSAGLAATAVLAFLGGLILNLMPCVFPVLGIKILGFVNQAGSDRRKVVLHGLVFTLGVLLSFWTLAGVLAVLRSGGEQLGWGFQLQSPGFVFALAVLLLVFAMNLSGIFEFGLGATGLGAGLQTKSGLSGSLFTGVLATVVATPCSAPFLAPALGAALAMPVSESFLVFTAIAVGLSAPYLLLSIFPSAVRVLPRPGAWMETFKQFMAFPLYATVGYLVWVLAGQASESGLLLVFFGLVVIALGLWFYGRLRAPGASASRARVGLVGGAALLAAGLWLGWPQAPAPTEIVWEPWSPELVAQYQREGRPIYLDFTARWCATCQTNKKLVFGSGEVLRQFAEKNVAALKADWTNKDPKITAELAKYQRSAIPFNLVYLPGEAAPRALPSLLTPSIVLDALNKKD